MTAEEMAAAMAGKITNLLSRDTLKTAGVVAGTVAGTMVLGDFLLRLQNDGKKNQMLRIERENLKKERRERANGKLVREAYNYEVPFVAMPENQVLDPQNGLVQKLYGERTGHTNTYGGRRY